MRIIDRVMLKGKVGKEGSPLKIMADVAPITPKNGVYSGCCPGAEKLGGPAADILRLVEAFRRKKSTILSKLETRGKDGKMLIKAGEEEISHAESAICLALLCCQCCAMP